MSLAIYEATITAAVRYESQDENHFNALFQSPESAEVAIAAAQQKIAPEDAWVSSSDGASFYESGREDQFRRYWACIEKREVLP